MLANQGNNLVLDSAIGHAIIDTGDQDNNVNPALLDATDNTKSNNVMPVATSSPKPEETEPEGANKQTSPVVPDKTPTPEIKNSTVQSDATMDPANVASGNKNTTDLVVSNSDEGTENAKKASDIDQNNKNSGAHLSLDNNNKPGNVNTENGESDDASTNTLDVKPTRGKFRTRIVGIQRQKDPRAFKCSCCSKCTMTLRELNAHFISTHRQVKCDICDQYFNMPSSLKSINTCIVMRNMHAGPVTMNSHLRANCALTATLIIGVGAISVFMQVVTSPTSSRVT